MTPYKDISCDKCMKGMYSSGALVFSPPWMNYSQTFHLCDKCYDKFLNWLNKDRD